MTMTEAMEHRTPRPTIQRRKTTSIDDGRPNKRARVAVACQRCKSRKQKCDGAQPVCGNCSSSQAKCEMIVPTRPMPFGKNQYIRSLEDRIAELESLLTHEGITEIGGDHWRRPSTSTSPTDGPLPVSQNKSTSRKESDDQQVDPNGTPSIVPDFHNLALYAGGCFIGEASDIKVIGSMIRSVARSREGTSQGTESPTSILSLAAPRGTIENGFPTPENVSIEGIDLTDIPDLLAEKMFRGYLRHVSTRWPLLHTSRIKHLQANRKTLTAVYDRSILHLIYAIGGRFIETTGQTGNFFAERHYAAVMVHLDELLQGSDVHSLEVLLLLAIYSLRAPHRPGAWDLLRSATGICIGLGYHRRFTRPIGLLEYEMRKRIFWTCYSLDRQVSITLGRPFAISDLDIDIELPYDVDEHIDDDNSLAEAIKAINEAQGLPRATTLSSFVHMARLRRIESYIQQRLYRVDQTKPIPSQEVDHILSRLTEWKEQIPTETTALVENDSSAADGQDYYMVYYYKCLRFLLYPLLFQDPLTPRYLRACASACGGVCHTYKRLLRTKPVGFSLMALHQVFLAGLTLLYCVWVSPQEFQSFATNKDINACSVLLYIIAERWPGASKYRDAFEEITQNVLELQERFPEGGGRMPLGKLGEMEGLVGEEEMGVDDRMGLSRMIGEMAGGGGAGMGGGQAGGGGEEDASGINDFVNNGAQVPEMVKFFVPENLMEHTSQKPSSSPVFGDGGRGGSGDGDQHQQQPTEFSLGMGEEDAQFPPDNLDLLNGIEMGDFMLDGNGFFNT